MPLLGTKALVFFEKEDSTLTIHAELF